MWIFGTNFSPTSKSAVEFDELVEKFRKTKDENLLEQIYLQAREIASTQREAFPELDLDKYFDREIALEFISCLVSDNIKTTPARKAKSLAFNHIFSEIEDSGTRYMNGFDFYSYTKKPGERLCLEDDLLSIIGTFPTRLKSSVIYLLYYPERLPLFKDFGIPLIDVIVIILALYKLKKIMKETPNLKFSFNLPTTQISRLLMVSALYKLSPQILVLMMLFKDLNSLLQFCVLFEEESFTIPKLDTVIQVIKKSSELAERLEDEEIAIKDRESLAYLATEANGIEEINPDTELNPVLTTFFEGIFGITLKNYDDFQQKLIKQVDLGDPEDILRVYDIMNQEIGTQINLLTQISSAIGNKDELNRIVESLSLNKTGE